MVASCFRSKLKWRPRLLAAAIRELFGACLTQSHPSPALTFFSPFPWLTCSSNLRHVLLQSTEIDFCFFSALRFVKNQFKSSPVFFSVFMRCDFFPQLLKPSNSLILANAIRDFNVCSFPHSLPVPRHRHRHRENTDIFTVSTY